jgi:hypothetical protein
LGNKERVDNEKKPIQLSLFIIIAAAGLTTNYYFLTPKLAYVESTKVIDSFTEGAGDQGIVTGD